MSIKYGLTFVRTGEGISLINRKGLTLLESSLTGSLHSKLSEVISSIGSINITSESIAEVCSSVCLEIIFECMN